MEAQKIEVTGDGRRLDVLPEGVQRCDDLGVVLRASILAHYKS